MNKPRHLFRGAIVLGFAVAFLALTVPSARTYPPFLAKAKSMNLPAKDCTYCHVNAAGGEPYNARGNWLVAEKGKRGASAVDVAWLKDYKVGGAKKGTAKKGAAKKVAR